ncbi:rod-binding protein [Vibrio sp.]|nr:rod-binding protein [Vibrio sp.]
MINTNMISSQHTSATQVDSVLSFSQLNKMKYSSNQPEALKQVTQQFEALMFQQILKSMRAASNVLRDEDSPLSSSKLDFAKELHDSQMAQVIAVQQQEGISSMLMQQLSPLVSMNSESKPNDTIMKNTHSND